MYVFRRLHEYIVDIRKPLARLSAGILLASADVKANEFVFTLLDGGEKFCADIKPIVTAYFQRPDGTTVKFEGEYNWHSASDGTLDTASVVLPKECYTRNGRFALTVKAFSFPDIDSTIAIIDGYVRRTSTDNVIQVDPDSDDGGSVSWASVPDYWQSHIDGRVNDVNTAMAAAMGSRSAFLFYSDAHWTYNNQQSPALLKYLCMNTPIKKVIFGGDIIDNESDLAYVDEWRERVAQLPWHHSVVGNHDDSLDDSGGSGDAWGLDEAYDLLLKPEVTEDVVVGGKTYYHIDVSAERTRYLFLDTATSKGNILNDPAQEAWLKQTLLSTPAGWHIICVSHQWWNTVHNADGSYTHTDTYTMGAGKVFTLIDAYNARTGDFASCRGWVEFCIGGHLHWDADFTSPGGIPVILVETDSKHVRSGLSCTLGTITENSVNAIVADYAAGVVHVIRIGRGSSRTVQLDGSGSEVAPDEPESDYDLVAPTGNFKNWLDYATEADGVTLYNGGHGYKNDIRLSTQSYEETAISGCDTTGFFPAKIGDVIRLHNVTLLNSDDNFASTGRAAVFCYDSSYNPIQSSQGFAPDSTTQDAWSPIVYGDNGDIVQFTIPRSWGTAAGVAYIRLVAKNITGASIITVNEEINITE